MLIETVTDVACPVTPVQAVLPVDGCIDRSIFVFFISYRDEYSKIRESKVFEDDEVGMNGDEELNVILISLAAFRHGNIGSK